MKLSEVQSKTYTVSTQPDTPILVKLFIKHANAGTLHIDLVDGDDIVFGGSAKTEADDAPNGILTFWVNTNIGERVVVIDLDDTDNYSYDLRAEHGTVWLYVKVQD